jgi:AraC-like DNA-binding protein
MACSIPDRIKVPRQFWRQLQKYDLAPAAALHHAHLPLVAYEDEAYLLTTAQFFALWRSIGEIGSDPAFGLNFASQVDFAALPLATLASYHARDYRDALTRQARFHQLCAPAEMRIQERRDECVILKKWLYATEEEPPLLVDACLAILVELGRRGAQVPIRPKRIDLKQRRERGSTHEAYFNCPVNFGASRNAIVLHSQDLVRPFVTYNAEFLEMVQSALEKKARGCREETSASEQVKWLLKQMLAGGRPDITDVARELRLSVRTLQRRIDEEGTTFRDLLLAVRQELVRKYFAQPGIQINEVAFQLGYEDTNSFYRAFRNWEGTTPSQWRTDWKETGVSSLS